MDTFLVELDCTWYVRFAPASIFNFSHLKRLSSSSWVPQHRFILNQLQLWVWGCVCVCLTMLYCKRGYLGFDVLSVSKVESTEQRVVLWGRLAGLILIQEDRWASHLHAQLLDSLLVVNRQQEGLEAGLGAHCGQDGEVLRKNTTCMGQKRRGQVSGLQLL